MAKTFNDLSTEGQRRGNLSGTVAKTLIDFDRAVIGSGIVAHPNARIMTGCITAAQGAEQIAAVTASKANRNQPITEAGDNTFYHAPN